MNPILGDLPSARWMYVKAILFLGILVASAGLVLLENPSWRVAGLLALVAWSAARLYYFMFYVIEKYADPTYRFAGVFDFVRYLVTRRARP